jgi:integrase
VCAILTEAKNLATATETKTVAGDGKQREQEVKGLILQFEVSCKNDGKEQTTIESYGKRLLKISENADIDNPESVKAYIATKETDNTKAGYVVAYSSYLSWRGKYWKAPKYRVTSPIPEFLPTEEEMDQLVAGCGKKTATILQVIKETGMRIGECMRLPWTSLNDKDNILTLNKPEKHGLPRILKISPKLVMMIQALPKQHEKIFRNTSAKNAACSYSDQRKRLALKVGNERLAKINFHLVRHWFGTMLYHKTHDLHYVMRMLGHRNITSTLIYINMEQALFSRTANEYHKDCIKPRRSLQAD